jgi:cAMP-dependent protein kinase regulator
MPGGSELLVNQLKPGQYFGEMALLGGGVRAATVKASHEGSVSVVALDEKAFNSLIDESRSLREELMGLIERRNTYNQLHTISSLDEKALGSILKEKKPLIFDEGHHIIKQGDVGDTFYILLDGKVDILVKNEHGDEMLVDQLSKGSYFGELALMGNKRRAATVRVSQGNSAKVLELSSQEFDQLRNASAHFKTHVHQAAGVRKKEIEGTQVRDPK